MGMSLIFMFVIAVVLVLYILAYWMIFRKQLQRLQMRI